MQALDKDKFAMPKIRFSPWLIAQGVGFQIFWFSCVIGQNDWLLASIALLALHFIASPQRLLDFKLIALAAIGISLDFLLTQLAFFEFAETPYWLGILWFGFVVCLAHSIKWLSSQQLFIQILFGGLAGCISYLTGERFAAVSFGFDYYLSAAALFIIWAILLPLLFKLVNFIEQKA